MPEARFELARGCPRWILSPLRLPFRHSGEAEKSPRGKSARKRQAAGMPADPAAPDII